MDNYKLHVKIGPYEFNGDGPADLVKEDYQAFKDLVGTFQVFPKPPDSQIETTIAKSPENGISDKNLERQLGILFAQDDKRGLVSLRILPRGKDRIAESLLLTVYGYFLIANVEEVGVTKLKAAMVQSGVAVDRPSTPAARYIDNKMLLKVGNRKGAKYRLTNTGRVEAKRLMEEMLKDSD